MVWCLRTPSHNLIQTYPQQDPGTKSKSQCILSVLTRPIYSHMISLQWQLRSSGLNGVKVPWGFQEFLESLEIKYEVVKFIFNISVFEQQSIVPTPTSSSLHEKAVLTQLHSFYHANKSRVEQQRKQSMNQLKSPSVHRRYPAKRALPAMLTRGR